MIETLKRIGTWVLSFLWDFLKFSAVLFIIITLMGRCDGCGHATGCGGPADFGGCGGGGMF